MIKLFILITLVLLGLTVYGADWWLEANNLSWEAIGQAWPFWLFSGLMGFLLGGGLLGLLVEFSFQRDSKKLKNNVEEEKELFKRSVYADVAEERETLSKRQQELNQQNHEAESTLAEAKEIREDVDRQIIEARADIEKNRKSAFNATKTVERLRQKLEKRD